MKKWVRENISTADKMLRKLGVSSLYELANSYLLLQVTYGHCKEKDDRLVLLVKIGTMHIDTSGNEILFEFQDTRIKMTLDSGPGGYIGDFEEEKESNASIEIESIVFHLTDGWSATYLTEEIASSIHKENLDVFVVTSRSGI